MGSPVPSSPSKEETSNLFFLEGLQEKGKEKGLFYFSSNLKLQILPHINNMLHKSIISFLPPLLCNFNFLFFSSLLFHSF